MIRLAAALLLIAAPAVAQVASGEAAAVAAATERGRLLFAYDRAAWLGTDDMLAKLPNPAAKLAGYIADGPAEAPRLIFYDKQTVPTAAYVAQFRDGKLIESKLVVDGADRTLSPDILRRIKAIGVARAAMNAAKHVPCSRAPFNSVVAPIDAAGSIRVYFLTAQTTTKELPFGGHFAVDVGPDGAAGKPRAFTRACLDLPIKLPAGAKDGRLGVSHLLDATPTELHVFSSLAAGQPLTVLTSDPTPRVWQIEAGAITGPQPFDPPKL